MWCTIRSENSINANTVIYFLHDDTCNAIHMYVLLNLYAACIKISNCVSRYVLILDRDRYIILYVNAWCFARDKNKCALTNARTIYNFNSPAYTNTI